MTYSEMNGIPTPICLLAGNVIRFSILDQNNDPQFMFDGIGMITNSDHDYYGEEDEEFRVRAVRYCLEIKCGDGMVRNASIYYEQVDHQTSPLAAQFDDGIYEPIEDLTAEAGDLIIHEVFEC